MRGRVGSDPPRWVETVASAEVGPSRKARLAWAGFLTVLAMGAAPWPAAEASTVATVVVTPATATGNVNQGVLLEAKALDADGNEVPDVEIVWTTDFGTLTDLVGFETTLIAGAAGVATVGAFVGAVSDTAVVTITSALDVLVLMDKAEYSTFEAQDTVTGSQRIRGSVVVSVADHGPAPFASIAVHVEPVTLDAAYTGPLNLVATRLYPDVAGTASVFGTFRFGPLAREFGVAGEYRVTATATWRADNVDLGEATYTVLP